MQSRHLYVDESTKVFFNYESSIYDAFKSIERTPEQESLVATTIINLINRGFSLSAINKLIDSVPSDGAVMYLSTRISNMMHHFSDETVVTILDRGKIRGIMAIEKHLEFLMSRNFTAEQIFHSTAKTGGCLAIEALVANYDALRAIGFSHEQIYSISRELNAAENMKALAECAPSLISKKFNYQKSEFELSIEDICRVAQTRAGDERLKLLKKLSSEVYEVDFWKTQLLNAAKSDTKAGRKMFMSMCESALKKAQIKNKGLKNKKAKPATAIDRTIEQDAAILLRFIAEANLANLPSASTKKTPNSTTSKKRKLGDPDAELARKTAKTCELASPSSAIATLDDATNTTMSAPKSNNKLQGPFLISSFHNTFFHPLVRTQITSLDSPFNETQVGIKIP